MVKVLIADDQVLIRAGIAAILRAAPGYEVVGEACDGEEAVTMAELAEPDVVLMDIRMPQMDGIAATRRILAPGRDAAHLEKLPRILILTTFDLDEYVYKALRAGASGFVLKDTPPERLLAALKAVADGDTLFSPTVTRRLVEIFCAVEDGAGGGASVALGTGTAAGPGTVTSSSTATSSGAAAVPASGASAWPPLQARALPGDRRTAATDRAAADRAGSDRAANERSAAGRAALAALTARETDVLRLVATGLSNGEIAERLVVSEGTVKTHLNRSMAKLNLSSRAQVVVLAYESGLVVPGRNQTPAQPPVSATLTK